MPAVVEPLVITRVNPGHPDAVALTAQVQAYYVRIYGGPDGSPWADEEFSPPNGAFFVGYDAGRAVAIGGWRWHRDPIDIPARRPAEVKRMYVVEGARRGGLARRVLMHLEEAARAAGADALVLETGRRQPEALGLYRAAGFVDIPPFGHYACQPGSVHLGKAL